VKVKREVEGTVMSGQIVVRPKEEEYEYKPVDICNKEFYL